MLLDVDGVLHVGWRAVPGAAAALAALGRAGLPFRLLTNTTTVSRATLGDRLRGMGLPVADDALLTAPLVTADYLRRSYPEARCFLIAKGDVADDLRAAGVELAPDEEGAPAEVVVLAGAEEELTYARLNRAYRLLLGGAALVAMHRNRAWRTEAGMALDVGPFVRALEEAAGVEATTVGKPAPAFFRHGVQALGVPAAEAVMVGDDAANDLAPARRLGLRTVLVRTGKPVGPAEERQADLVLDSVAALPAALGIEAAGLDG
ncbi:MAG: HAD-IIA family hydrolase [Chloroflexota bacterium]|nr:HAD-IIA family hydrolase [Chloroflexota bacterium]